MQTRTILLLSATFLFCVLQHARAIPWYEERFEPSKKLGETAAATSLARSTRDIASNLTSIVEQLVSGTVQLPADIVQTIVRVIRTIFATITSTIQSATGTVRSTIYTLVSDIGDASENLLRRKRQTLLDLTEQIPNMLRHPLSLLETSLDSARNYANGQMAAMAQQVASALWTFATTILLPWLHAAVQQLEKSNNLPSGLRNVLQDFDYAYRLLNTLG